MKSGMANEAMRNITEGLFVWAVWAGSATSCGAERTAPVLPVLHTEDGAMKLQKIGHI